MTLNLHARWLKLLHTLWFVPSAIAVAYIALAQVLVKLDADERFSNMWVFGGGAHAARTVLSVIAGSLITVAGLTFSLTMIVLQLTSSQFSPRVVRNYLGDRIAQVTIGSFVGIFAFCLLALRSVGDQSEQPAVPRLTVTVASGLALFALAMLIAFIHHIAQLVQASELSGRLGRETLEAIERLYPSHFGEAVTPDKPEDLVERWRREEPAGIVLADHQGFVQSVELSNLVGALPDPDARVHVLVAPGDFAYAHEPVAEVWPSACVDSARDVVLRNITAGGERDIDQDAHFGFRQLTDIALRAISPSVNDPTTAATCIAYLRSALTCLAAREFPSAIRQIGNHTEQLVARRRTFGEYLESFAEIGRYAAGDARVVRDLLGALAAIGRAAAAVGAGDRAANVREVAAAIAEQALAEVRCDRDRGLVREALREVEHLVDGTGATAQPASTASGLTATASERSPRNTIRKRTGH